MLHVWPSGVWGHGFSSSRRCQPRPSSLCPQPAASSQSLLWQRSGGTFCGEAEPHQPNKRFWPIRERFLSAGFGLDGRLRRSRKCESVGAGGRRRRGKGHQLILTIKHPWECVAAEKLLHSLGELRLGEAGLSWRFLWWETYAFLISSYPSSLMGAENRKRDVSVRRPCQRWVDLQWIKHG